MATVMNIQSGDTLTMELSAAKLIQGPQGEKGEKGDKGDIGPQGAAFTYEDFTPAQLEALTGPQGPKGETGETGPKGDKGDKGDTGLQGVQGIQGEKGNDGVSPVITGSKTGKTTTLTVTDGEGTRPLAIILDGADGEGSGDMRADVYDPQGKARDVFQYVDNAVAGIPTPDVSGQIGAHDTDGAAHEDIRAGLAQKQDRLTFDDTPTAGSGNPVTSGGVKAELDKKANSASLGAHTGAKENPHEVTAAQVGALPLSGGTLTGALTLSGDPAAGLHAATKGYVDTAVADKASKTYVDEAMHGIAVDAGNVNVTAATATKIWPVMPENPNVDDALNGLSILSGAIIPFPVAEGYTVTPGDVINVINGYIEKDIQYKGYASCDWDLGWAPSGLRVCALNSNTFAVTYSYSADYSYSKAAIATVENGSISISNDVSISGSGGFVNDIARLSDSRFVVSSGQGYNYLYIFDVENQRISSARSSDYSFLPQQLQSETRLVRLTESRFAVFYGGSSTKLNVSIVDFDGSNFTKIDTQQVFSTGQNTISHVSRLIPFENSVYIIGTYQTEINNANSYRTVGRLVTFHQNNIILGEIQYLTEEGPIGAAWMYSYSEMADSNMATILYTLHSSVRIATINVNSGEIVSDFQILENGSSKKLINTGDNWGIFCIGGEDVYSCYFQLIPKLATSIGTSSPFLLWNAEENCYGVVDFALFGDNPESVFLARRSKSNRSQLKIYGASNQSKEAIALDSGNAGDIVRVAYSGNVVLPGITKGTKIESDCVNAKSYVDGFLSIEQPRISSDAQIIAGSYVGTGTYGENNPNNSLTFDFEPKFLFVRGESISTSLYGINGWFLWCAGDGTMKVFVGGSNTSYRTYVTLSGNTISWYNEEAAVYQLNMANNTYYYIAIG